MQFSLFLILLLMLHLSVGGFKSAFCRSTARWIRTIHKSTNYYKNSLAATSNTEQEVIDRLRIVNGHPNDNRISFDSQNHKYFYDGIPMQSSVTQLIREYFDEFDSKAVAIKMMSSQNWPRKGYVHANGKPFNLSEILYKWDVIGEYARNKGIWMHYNIERILNDLPVAEENLPEISQFLTFKSEMMDDRQIVPYRTEWRIAAPDYSIAGSVDFVGKDSEGNFIIMDWKRSKNLQASVGPNARKTAR